MGALFARIHLFWQRYFLTFIKVLIYWRKNSFLVLEVAFKKHRGASQQSVLIPH